MSDDSLTGWKRVMPAEWRPHEATWLSWPRNQDTWPRNLAAAQAEMVALIRAIAEDEPVRVLAGKPDDYPVAERMVGAIANVEVVPIQTNDAWARDYAPTFVIGQHGNRRELIAVDWHYNAWGGKYPPFDQDQKVAQRIAQWLGCRHAPVDLCLEGGAVEVDGEGTLLCTRTCAFDPHRNPTLSEGEVERRMVEALGTERVIWLAGDALIGDDTDGHIDQLARFAPDGKILYAWTEDTSDSQRPGLEQNLQDLRDGLDRLGLHPELIALPLPDPVRFAGVQIPACYCNFYVTNGSVIVPRFGVPQDETAVGIIAEAFPGRKTVSLSSVHLTVGLGSFHCLTQQQPSIAVD